MVSLKRMGYISFTSVAGLLTLVIFMGVRQYQLTERYNSIITQSEAMIFQFSTLREQVTTALIAHDWKQVSVASDQLESLNSTLSRIQENTLIPGEYRLDLAKQADISGLAILSKEIPISGEPLAKGLELQHKMRTLTEYIIRFDRIIVSQMRAKLIQFQTLMIGSLAVIICLISFTLTLFYKKTMLPLFRLSKQIEHPEVLETGLHNDSSSCTELSDFTDSVNKLLQQSTDNSLPGVDGQQIDEALAATFNQNTNLANGIINYAQLLVDSYREVGIGSEERKILESIIEAAEQIAVLHKNSIKK
jgi:hypothetical protein